MDRNPHAHTYTDPRAHVTVPAARRSRMARMVRAFHAEEAAAWRRGKPGRLAVAADTFGAVATWWPRWRSHSPGWRQANGDRWRWHRVKRTAAANRAARVHRDRLHAHQRAA